MRLLTLVVAVLLQTAQPARVSSVGGDAEIIRSDGAAPVRSGDAVLAGDRLHTRPASSLVLSTSSGIALRLGGDSSLELKKLEGESVAFLAGGSLNVKTAGKPVRIETRFGLFVATEDSQEFDIRYVGDGLEVVLTRGTVRAEVPDASKVAFRSAADSGSRVYEAGSISPTLPREPGNTTVIVYPQIGNGTR